jgi:hypothetical protein
LRWCGGRGILGSENAYTESRRWGRKRKGRERDDRSGSRWRTSRDGAQAYREGLQDESFRQRLLEDPRGAIEEELGTQLPEEVEVVAVEETAETIYLVLPSDSRIGGGGELSERELEAMAGGDGVGSSDTWSYC